MKKQKQKQQMESFQIIKDPSAKSRTNQLKILASPEDVAEKLFQYLGKVGKGIEHFELPYSSPESKDEKAKSSFYRKLHRDIKKKIKEQLDASGQNVNYSEIQYFSSYADGKNHVFFLSDKKGDSRWKRFFENHRERIFNLVFKFYLLDQVTDTISGFEELFLVHSKKSNKSKPNLFVWGHDLLVNYNQHHVLTLNLSRKHKRFLAEDNYRTLDGEDLGELLIHEKKNYYFDRNLDGRGKNDINFMQFPKSGDSEKYEKFKKTQLYLYQNLMTKLEDFLRECQINFERLDFQADHYLEKPFIQQENIDSVGALEIINNTGVDLTESDQEFLTNFLQHQGMSPISFYNSGKTISNYKKIEDEDEDAPCWEITEVESWSDIELDKSQNYLIFNKLLEEEAGSMAYLGDDDLWYPSTKIDKKPTVDFYSQLKRRFNYLETGEFFSTQGINISEFEAVKSDKEKSVCPVLTYTERKIDIDDLRKDTQPFTPGQLGEVEDHLFSYLQQQKNKEEWDKFWNKYKIKISPEYEKVFLELRIKNWMRQSILDRDKSIGLPISPQSFAEQEFFTFFTIYVRSFREKNKKTKAVAVQFIYKNGAIYIENIIRELNEIKSKFPFLRKRKTKKRRRTSEKERETENSEELINGQHYFVDESAEKYISCYTSDKFTPKLIGRDGILEEMEEGTLEINRGTSKLLPLVSYYNDEIKPKNKIQKMICLDLKNDDFIQYYVPSAQNIPQSIPRAFRVYHFIGKTYAGEPIPTSELIEEPIAALHFSTLTHDVLKISENSQSSLLQKIARVLIEN